MSSESEVELCFYAEIRDPSGLEKANAVEQHEQYQYQLPPDEAGGRRGRIRIRRTDKNNETSFTETIKTPHSPDSLLGDEENTVDITESFFKTWRHTYRADGFKKIRHTYAVTEVEMEYQGNTIKLPPLKFEVDIFVAPDGHKSKWAKIDIEVQDVIKMLKESYETVDAAQFHIKFSCLPLDIGQVVSAVTTNAEERAAIENFYKVYSHPYKAENA